MKKFELTKKDAFELASVLGAIVREKSEDLDFKEVLHLQKTSMYFISAVQDFSDAFDKLNDERNVHAKNANEKISAFREKLNKESEKDGKVDDNFKTKLETYVQSVLEEAQVLVDKEIGPMTESLYKNMGQEKVSLELEEEKHTMMLKNFELFAKEKYTNKSKMVEIYETLVSAKA